MTEIKVVEHPQNSRKTYGGHSPFRRAIPARVAWKDFPGFKIRELGPDIAG
jgi:hypothetical protein